jgi:hypothetical protein
MIRDTRSLAGLAAALGRCRRGRATHLVAATAASAGLLLALGVGATAASGDSCPNAAFRTGPALGLPDCRAYELVSPSDNNGGSVDPTPADPRAAVSSDGQHVLYKSAVAFPGASSNPVFSDYLSTRTSAGWTTTDLNPAGSTDVTSGINTPADLLDATSDFSRPVFASPFSLDPNDQDGDPLAGNSCSFAEGASCEDVYIRNPDGSWTWVSQNGQPKTSPVPTAYAGESADQSHVLFEAQAPLTPDDSGQVAGLALYDRTAGHTVLVGVRTGDSLTSACGAVIAAPPTIGSTGAQTIVTLGSLQPSNAVSSDGSRVFFESPDPAGSGDASCSTQQGGTQPVEIYLRQGNATTTEISMSQKTGSVGTPAPDGATFQAATPDGSKVLFTSPDALTDDATGTGPYLYEYNVDASGNPLTFLAANAQAAPNQVGSVIGFSTDLSYIYFFSSVGGTTLWHDGRLATVPNSSNSVDAEVTPDGRRLVFADGITANSEVYLYDAPSGNLSCLSCSPGGGSAAGPSGLETTLVGSVGHLGLESETEGYLGSRVISDDGSRVFFWSTNPLVPQAVNGQQNVYEWENGTIHLISDATGPSGSQLLGASASGNDVFFATGDSLVPQDQTNGDVVVYDARVGGGFAEPLSPPVCQGEACQGQPSAPPLFGTPGSAVFSGSGNLAPPPPVTPTKKVTKCAKHKKLRHGKCVKVKNKKARKSKPHQEGK